MKRYTILFLTITLFFAVMAAQNTSWAATNNSNNSTVTVNINTANLQQLQLIPHIGPKTAARIVSFRKEHGKFKSIDQIMKVKGIGAKRFKQIARFITVNGPTSAGAKK